MSKSISVNDLSEAINENLDNYNREVIDDIKKSAKNRMDQLVEDTKATAPVGHRKKGHYRNSITSKKEWENELGAGYIWYVKGSNYRLSHLLEYGHATRKGGRTKAFGFIKKASDKAIEDYLKDVEEAVKR